MLQARLDPEQVTDEVLAARARDGGQTAFVELVGRHQDRVYRLAVRMCRNSADAEEISQETFILAHRGMASFHGDSRFSTWLYRIAINQVLMRHRAARRRPAESLDALEPSANGWPVATTIEAPECADELVHRKVLTERVLAALADLDESHRAALVLRDLEELTAEEAADILGVSADVVRQRSRRARLKLREQLRGLLRPAD